jgi:hypothetical protein
VQLDAASLEEDEEEYNNEKDESLDKDKTAEIVKEVAKVEEKTPTTEEKK